MAPGETRVVRNGFAERRGRTPIAIGTAPDSFISEVTTATVANTGYRYPLEVWAGTTGTFTITSPGIYERTDFGSTWIDVKAPNVTLRDNKHRNTKDNPSRRPLILADDAAVSSLVVEHSEFVNAPLPGNKTPGMTAITGHDFIFRRNSVRHFSDCINTRVRSTNIDGNVNVQILDNYLADLSFWYDPVEGVVHPSDTKTHNDCIQHEGGRGLQIIGNTILAFYSQTVGTMYTTGQAGDPRYDIVDGGGAYSSSHLGGSIFGIMVNGDRGGTFDGIIRGNKGSGGSFWLNAGSSSMVSPFGIVHKNVVQRNQRTAGWAIGIANGVTADVGAGTANRNTWGDDGTEIIRKNG